MKIAVSACLLGRNCKYNGGNNLDEALVSQLEGHEVVAVCPEVEGGLPTPRPPAELREGRVVNAEGADVTLQFELGAQKCLKLAEGCDLAVLKSKSPSCGVHQVYDGSFSGFLVPGKGVFASVLEREGIPAVEPADLVACAIEDACESNVASREAGENAESPACSPCSFDEGPQDGPVLDGDNLHVYPQAMFGTAYVYDVETEDGDPVRLLEVGGVFESATYLDERRFEPAFEYYRAFDRLFEAFPQPERVLMLGGGGFAYPKHFVASQPFGAMDVVEIDPVITRIAYERFFLGELVERYRTAETGRLRIVTADARAYVEELACGDVPLRYDVIINDSFSGDAPTEWLAGREGLDALKRCLAPNGLLMVNFICDVEADASDLVRLLLDLRSAFAYVHVIPCVDETFGGEDNNLVIATDGEYEFSDCLPSPEKCLFSLSPWGVD
ncbi:MAG: fused MFS/spermidine synthase [Eggerthellaceae bacterium]|nr:fused MFS/spermidine synthase [Eggerthellaceae bacterium]